ncbi:hypothetical protein QBC44DRAFT_136002 [Cladorrhinum sp. PSN332]|nr:hypothetical protein QBC44DRAFT_136002 [Cladorrhinum sp. PSN332]
MYSEPETEHDDTDHLPIAYVQRSLEVEEDFHFLRLEFLQRLNIVHHQVKLVRMKSQFQKEQKASEAQLEDLSASLKAYTSAIRDYEFLRGHAPLTKSETTTRKLRLQRYFQTPSDHNDPWHSHYAWLNVHHDKHDPLRRFFMRNFPSTLSFSSHEKKERKKEYMEGELPKQVSPAVDGAARFIIALAGGAFVVVPMIIMSINQTPTKSLITVSSAVVVFALMVSMGIRVSNIETLVATATYAAVLVVFVGATSGSN